MYIPSPLKHRSIQVGFVQARRITCGHCNEFFTYLVTGTKWGNTTGIHFLSSRAWMTRNALHSARLKIAGLARRRHAGLARCPYCRRYQSAMVTPRRWRRAIKGLLWGILCGVLALIVLQEFLGLQGSSDLNLRIVSGVAAGLALFAWISTPGTAPRTGTADPAVLKDNALDALLEHEADGWEPDPFLRLGESLDRRLAAAPRISLGLMDSTKRPLHEEWDTHPRLAALADRKADLESLFGLLEDGYL